MQGKVNSIRLALTEYDIDNAVSLDGAKLLVSYLEEYAKAT